MLTVSRQQKLDTEDATHGQEPSDEPERLEVEDLSLAPHRLV